MSSLQVSRPMLILLGVTIALTASSFAVRSWRESASLPSVIEGAEPARPAQDAPLAPGETATPQAVRTPEMLRPIWPTATIDAMAVPNAPAPGPTGEAGSTAAAAAAPPPPALPPPTFRLIGRFADGKEGSVFFVQGEELIAAKPGQTLPDGFVLKSVRHDKVVVVRTADGHQFDMTLEAP